MARYAVRPRGRSCYYGYSSLLLRVMLSFRNDSRGRGGFEVSSELAVPDEVGDFADSVLRPALWRVYLVTLAALYALLVRVRVCAVRASEV